MSASSGERNSGRGGTGAAAPYRTLPHALEAEEHLLSCIILDESDTIARCLESRVTPEAFYNLANGVIYDTCVKAYHDMGKVSVEVVAQRLRDTKQLEAVGGLSYFNDVVSRVPTTAHATFFIEEVRKYHMLRQYIRAASNGIEQCYRYEGEAVTELFDRLESDIFRVTQDRMAETVKRSADVMETTMRNIRFQLENRGAVTGIPSGFKDVDEILHGFQRTDMIVLAARPSMGKTALAMNFVEHAVAAGHASLVFSLEMSAAQLGMRFVCSRAGVNMEQLRKGVLMNPAEATRNLQAAADEYAKFPLFIDDNSTLTIMEIRAKARRVHARTPLSFIAVDYLQLISGTDPRVPREQQVAEISRGLKQLGKELEVPVLVLSQLNRNSENEKRPPRLSDLRESGSIEQDADVVLLIGRPKEADEHNVATAWDWADLYVAKQRNGRVGDLKLSFNRAITRFHDYHPDPGAGGYVPPPENPVVRSATPPARNQFTGTGGAPRFTPPAPPDSD